MWCAKVVVVTLYFVSTMGTQISGLFLPDCGVDKCFLQVGTFAVGLPHLVPDGYTHEGKLEVSKISKRKVKISTVCLPRKEPTQKCEL
jgi:hypothetical protein